MAPRARSVQTDELARLGRTRRPRLQTAPPQQRPSASPAAIRGASPLGRSLTPHDRSIGGNEHIVTTMNGAAATPLTTATKTKSVIGFTDNKLSAIPPTVPTAQSP